MTLCTEVGGSEAEERGNRTAVSTFVFQIIRAMSFTNLQKLIRNNSFMLYKSS